MSLVTSVVIVCPAHCSKSDSKRNWIDLVNDWMMKNYIYAKEGCNLFINCTDMSIICAGTKHPQSKVYVGGFNFFPEKEFIKFFKELNWPQAQLLIRNEHAFDMPHDIYKGNAYV